MPVATATGIIVSTWVVEQMRLAPSQTRTVTRSDLFAGSFSRESHHACNPEPKVGLTGLEPVTLRLSSACSNQLSYRPAFRKVNSD